MLGGGITNHNYLITVAGEPGAPGVGRFVLRIPGDGTDAFIDREREHRNHVAAAAVRRHPAGAAPDPAGLLLDRAVHRAARPCTPRRSPDIPSASRRSSTAVRTYHDKAVFDNEIRVFDMIRDYTRMAARARRAPARADRLDARGRRGASSRPWSATSPRRSPATTICSSENFILAPDGKMWVIDWEYGGMTDPYFDLGDFCVEHPLSAAEERFVLTRLLRRHGRAPLRPHDAPQAGRRPVVEHLGHDPGAASPRSTSTSTSTASTRIARFCDNAGAPRLRRLARRRSRRPPAAARRALPRRPLHGMPRQARRRPRTEDTKRGPRPPSGGRGPRLLLCPGEPRQAQPLARACLGVQPGLLLELLDGVDLDVEQLGDA